PQGVTEVASGIPPCSVFQVESKRAAPCLLVFNGLEEGLEVPLAKASRPVALDDLEEEGGTVLYGLGEDLEQVALLVAIDEDSQVGDLADVLGDRADAVGEQLIIGARDLQERDIVGAHRADRGDDIVSGHGNVLDARSAIELQELLDLRPPAPL